MSLVANNQYQKIANSCLIIRELIRGRKSRIGLAHLLGLQPSTVTYSTARLIESGLIREEEASSGGKSGRKGILLGLNPDYGRVCGIELLVGYYRIVTCDISGSIISHGTYVYDDTITAPLGTKERFIQLLACTRRQMEILTQGYPIRGVCIAIAGIISHDFHTIIDSWTHGLHGDDFAEHLLSCPYPVWFENDANCAAQKALFKDKFTNDSFLYSLVHYYKKETIPSNVPAVGIGMGVVIDGSLYRGWTNRAGEFRSVLYSGSSFNGQLALTNENLIALETDEHLQRAFMKELLSNLFSAEAIINPRTIFLGGDLVKKALVERVLQTEFPSMGTYVQEEESLFHIVDDATWDVSHGACITVLSSMFHIPHVGEQNLMAWEWKERIGQ
ncbi:MAG: ROK family transcriptional regulator [Sphaerochaetaceae bacterium]|jgi:predicted NBD/HSP70 family sugar kinase